jgi:hypothetical protein
MPEKEVVTSNYTTSSNTQHSVVELSGSALQEQLIDSRFLRTMNCVFKYDFKVGNYLPDDAKKLNTHLFATIKDVTTGIKKASWFISEDFNRLLQGNFATHLLYFSDIASQNSSAGKMQSRASEFDSTFVPNAPHSGSVSPTGGFYNLFITLSSSNNILNTR